MLNFFRGRIFGGKVLKALEANLRSILGDTDAEECLGAFATVTLNSDIPKDFVENMRLRGFSVNDTALAYFDASVTALKKVQPSTGFDPDVDALLRRMERAIDHMFLDFKGMIVPRNGTAGPKMAEFTKEI